MGTSGMRLWLLPGDFHSILGRKERPVARVSRKRCVFRSQGISLTSTPVSQHQVRWGRRPAEVPPSDESVWRAVVRVLRSTANGTLDSLCSVLFPADCRVCNLPLSGFTLLPVCSSCWNNLPTQPGVLCMRCGEALAGDSDTAEQSFCRPCRQAPPAFRKAVAHGVYEGPLRTLLHLLKYEGMEPLAKRLGTLLADQILAIPELPGDLLIVPVPLYGKKRRQRGFNQSALLARGALEALRTGRPALQVKVADSALTRRRATQSQAGLSPHQRRVNVRGAFFVSRGEAVAGRNVLLIDDIYTTGATARACSEALRRAGAKTIWVATVARAQKESALRQQPMREWEHETGAAEPDLPMEEDVAFWTEGCTAPTGGTAR